MKSFADPEQNGNRVRRWSLWGPIRCATCNFAFVSSKARHKIAWMAGLFEYHHYDDFNSRMGSKWAYYLFRLLNRETWLDAKNAIWAVGRLLERKKTRTARLIVGLVELGSPPDLQELESIWPEISILLGKISIA